MSTVGRRVGWLQVLVAATSVACGGGGDGAPDAGVDARVDALPMNACPAPTGAGTEHAGGITADETWRAADGPHVVTFDVTVTGATLTIEPCAVVRLRKGTSVFIGGSEDSPNAALVAHGESLAGTGGAPATRRPVVFERDDAGEPWGALVVYASGVVDLEVVDLRGGGDPDTAANNGGTLVAAGAGGSAGLTRNVRVRDVLIDGSGGFGANLQARAGFSDDSSGLRIRGAGALPSGTNIDTRYPVYIDGPAISTLPAGEYTGNAVDEIFVAASGSMTDESLTFHDRAVPYRLAGVFSMAPVDTAEDGGLSTLTLEAGVVIKLAPGQPMVLGVSNGALPANIWPVRLVAAGTADRPIVLTSGAQTPAAGDWSGIAWAGGPASGNTMAHVRVEYAGGYSGTVGFGCGPSANDAALIITNWKPNDGFITSCTFSDSAGGGIVSGWASDDGGPNFTQGNTFTNIASGCNVSRWATAPGECPSPPPICF